MSADRLPSATVRLPLTGEEVDVRVATPDEVRAAADRAREAQADWARRDLADRCRLALRFHDLLLSRREEVLDLVQLETGKARRHAFEEVADAANVARYYGRSAPEQLRRRERRHPFPGLVRAEEHRRPVGLVGIIAPWNYPLTLAVSDAIPALLAGNAVLLKPDTRTASTARWAADLLGEAGLPPDLFQVLPGPGAEVGGAVTSEVDHVAFTGGTETGREVARQAADRLVGCSLELGGKNPMVVLADADPERAAAGAVAGCFASAGQLCVSIERIYVEEPIFDPFRDRLVERARGLALGAELDYGPDMGCLVSEEHLEAVDAYVQDARDRGATVLTGGRRRPDVGPLFYEPTLLTGVHAAMELHDEEVFGPVAYLEPVEDADEAVERANDTRYGLNASVWSGNLGRGREIARRIQAGAVNVNDAYSAAWGAVDAPFGGVGESGLGRRHGKEGILRFTESRTVATQRRLALTPPRGRSASLWARAVSAALRVLRRSPLGR